MNWTRHFSLPVLHKILDDISYQKWKLFVDGVNLLFADVTDQNIFDGRFGVHL